MKWADLKSFSLEESVSIRKAMLYQVELLNLDY